VDVRLVTVQAGDKPRMPLSSQAGYSASIRSSKWFYYSSYRTTISVQCVLKGGVVDLSDHQLSEVPVCVLRKSKSNLTMPLFFFKTSVW
jgi:hypothetical protein